MGLRRTVHEWGPAEKLTDKWLEEHKPHGLLPSYRRTIFDGRKGKVYEEHRCYQCRAVARKFIENAPDAKTLPPPPKKKKFEKGSVIRQIMDLPTSTLQQNETLEMD